MRKVILTLTVAVIFILHAAAQSRTITGRVNDEKGMPVAGVSVLAGKSGTQTDKSGDYSINVNGNVRSLSFSSVGFEPRVMPVNSSVNVLNVVLKTADARLTEVVITGYTTRKKSEFTGADSKVTAQKIEQVPVASFEQILQGRAPGLYIASGSGQPGTVARVNIRGVGSISGGNDPLYIVDGIPIEDGVFRSINPNDFETVDILKDAAGAGLYGSRGANGVIVITTKKGRPGKTLFQYRGQVGFAEAPTEQNLQLMNTAQRLSYEANYLGPAGVLGTTNASGYPGWDWSPNNPANASLSAAALAVNAGKLDSIGKINTDWSKIFFRRGAFKQSELNASGGTENIRFYTSLSAYQQQGVLQRSSLDRYTFRSNIDFKADRVTASIHSYAGYSVSKGIESEAGVALANPVAAAYLELPYRQLYKSPGVIDTGVGKVGADAYDRANTSTSTSGQFKGSLAITIQYHIWDGLSLKTTDGVDYRNNNQSRFIDPNQYAGRQITTGQAGSYGESFVENVQFISTTGLVYNKTFRRKHQVNLQLMSESITNRARTFNATGFGINHNLPNTPSAITPGSTTNNEIPTIGGNKFHNGISSVFVNGDYTYNRKYTISGSLRRDVTSEAPKGNRTVVEAAGGLSWNMSEEAFMKKQRIFQDARLRASYGESANLNGFTSEFGYLSTYGIVPAAPNNPTGVSPTNGTGPYAGTSGVVPVSPANPNYKIETQLLTNVGFDVSLWNRRLRITADFYKKESKNLFIAQGLSNTTGFTAYNTNAGKMENRGLDFGVNADVVSNKTLLITIGVNGGFLRNRITSLGTVSEIPQGTGIVRVGVPFGTHYQVGYLGVNPQSGLPVYEDINGNPTTDYSAANKRATYGTYLPKFTGGASLDASWNDFDLSVLLNTAQGVKRFDNESFFFENTNANFQYNKDVRMLGSWQVPGQMTDFQKINSVRQFSSKDIRDASFVRLRNVQLGYTFNTKAGKPIRSFRIWGQGENLYTWTKWTGFDPEESNNIATYEFPNPKTYSIGLDINF